MLINQSLIIWLLNLKIDLRINVKFWLGEKLKITTATIHFTFEKLYYSKISSFFQKKKIIVFLWVFFPYILKNRKIPFFICTRYTTITLLLSSFRFWIVLRKVYFWKFWTNFVQKICKMLCVWDARVQLKMILRVSSLTLSWYFIWKKKKMWGKWTVLNIVL